MNYFWFDLFFEFVVVGYFGLFLCNVEYYVDGSDDIDVMIEMFGFFLVVILINEICN